MVPAEDNDKSVQSTKSGSSKGSAKDAGKTLSLINNAFKTMGKALSQELEELVPLKMMRAWKSILMLSWVRL